MNRKSNQTNFFLHNDLALKIKMDCRTVAACRFRERLGSKSNDVINIKERRILEAILTLIWIERVGDNVMPLLVFLL